MLDLEKSQKVKMEVGLLITFQSASLHYLVDNFHWSN